MGKKRNYILQVSRDSPRWRNRNIFVIGQKRNITEISAIPVPNGLIICDACNDEIKTPKVNILVVNGSEWGTVCEGCRASHHSKLPIIERE